MIGFPFDPDSALIKTYNALGDVVQPFRPLGHANSEREAREMAEAFERLKVEDAKRREMARVQDIEQYIQTQRGLGYVITDEQAERLKAK